MKTKLVRAGKVIVWAEGIVCLWQKSRYPPYAFTPACGVRHQAPNYKWKKKKNIGICKSEKWPSVRAAGDYSFFFATGMKLLATLTWDRLFIIQLYSYCTLSVAFPSQYMI